MQRIERAASAARSHGMPAAASPGQGTIAELLRRVKHYETVIEAQSSKLAEAAQAAGGCPVCFNELKRVGLKALRP